MPDLEPIKRQLREIYEAKSFPILCLVGGVLLTGLTNDVLWALIGAGCFVVYLFKRGGLK